MRKFTNKNRQKRKYTRKTVQTASSPLTKTVSAGLLPLFILAVAFATTLLMTQIKGQPIALHYSLTLPQLQMPTFQLSAPQVPDISVNLFPFIEGISTAFYTFFQIIGLTITTWATHVASVLNPQPALAAIGTGLVSFAFFVQRIALLIEMGIVQGCVVILQAFIVVGNTIANATAFMLQTIAMGFLSLCTAILHAMMFVAMILLVVIKAIVSTVVTVGTFIGDKVSAFFNGLVSLIEIPFKLLWKFWVQIKPYMDILGKHIGMTGADLQNGFASWGKVASLVPPPSK